MPVFSIPLSGLNSNSAALTTIANNLANLNTVGYKQARTLFRDLFYQTIGTTGSGNPIQMGAGSAVDAIATNFTPGSTESTGVNSDVAIGGDGFFVVQRDGITSYTRAGNFVKGKDGTLQTSTGEQVMGFPAPNGQISQLQGLVPIMVGSGYISPPNPTSWVQLTTNLDANAAVGEVYTAPMNIYDSLGQSHSLKFTFTKTGAGAWDYQISIPGEDVGSANASVTVRNGALAFDGNGNLTTPNANVSGITISGFADGASDLTFAWNLYSGIGSTLTQVASPSSTTSSSQDGFSSGSLRDFSIGSDGVVEGTFSNGKSMALGQLVLANFPNSQGLLRMGGNSFQATLASGAASIGAPGTGGRGALSGGALELSNVDIATEFAKLIMAQRGFQANARAITTFDEITQETINLKR
jgi:flagellar hook protein FlgE